MYMYVRVLAGNPKKGRYVEESHMLYHGTRDDSFPGLLSTFHEHSDFSVFTSCIQVSPHKKKGLPNKERGRERALESCISATHFLAP